MKVIMLNKYSKLLFFLIIFSGIFVKKTYCTIQPSQETLLHKAIESSDIHTVQTLLASNVNPNARKKSIGCTYTPLHSAVQLIKTDPTSALHIIRLLLDNGANPKIKSQDTLLGGEGKSALEIVSFLRNKGEGYEKALALFNEKLNNPKAESASCSLRNN